MGDHFSFVLTLYTQWAKEGYCVGFYLDVTNSISQSDMVTLFFLLFRDVPRDSVHNLTN